VYIDRQAKPAKLAAMKNPAPPTLAALKTRYQRLGRNLARIGYISLGSVQQRTVAASGRSGYQWTRKVAQKTLSVALSSQQYAAMKEAVLNERKLWKIVQEMERVSRRIIFASAPDTRRRKRLSKKVLGLI
jgi:capsule polysaccharide export protein KpsE/RkpR